VEEHARADDLVIDHDAIALALSRPGTPHHLYPKAAGELARAIRWATIDAAFRIARAASVDLWIVHAYPLPADVSMYTRLGAVTRHMTADDETLLERARAERPERMQKILIENLEGVNYAKC
jgi:hypothetical protein